MARNLKKYYAKLFKKLSKLLEDRAFIEEYSTKDKAFSRERILSFKTVTLLILQLLKSSLKTELKKFHTTVFRKDEIVNWAAAIGDVKRRTVLPFLRGLEKTKSIIESIQGSFRVNTEAVRKGRKFPRDKHKK